METLPKSHLSERGGDYPVDILCDVSYETLKKSSDDCLSHLQSTSACVTSWFVPPDSAKVKIKISNVARFSLFGDDDPAHTVLALVQPGEETQLLALYLDGRWWSVADVMKTSNPSRVGLVTVQSVGERVVLFLLSQFIFGILERPLESELAFSLHPAGELGKITWSNGEAVGFYTVKRKGSLCDSFTSQSYKLPVLDTLFVRRHWRRRGFALEMLEDFCSSFGKEEALGISNPISPSMYEVCRKYLLTHQKQRDRLYEVEAPGGWGERRSVWLQIQLSHIPKNSKEQALSLEVSKGEVNATEDLKEEIGASDPTAEQLSEGVGASVCDTQKTGHKRRGTAAGGAQTSKQAKTSN
ncbi:protein FAM169B [Amia ocellicauda]|uniref:protein FAM169B n=1 Tax=Amia ocellicauda TaxID=2972642 RepID=UPI0034642357